MSRLIRPCPDCPGYHYEGEACRCCAAIAQARRQAAETMRERCAAIADAYKGAGESGYATAHHIADEIRALGVTP